jgi:hypothetical protein
MSNSNFSTISDKLRQTSSSSVPSVHAPSPDQSSSSSDQSSSSSRSSGKKKHDNETPSSVPSVNAPSARFQAYQRVYWLPRIQSHEKSIYGL